jgi:hypothetical protein
VVWVELSGLVEARHLATPLTEATALALHADASRARKKLEALSFDQAPVMHKKRVQGWVATGDLPTAGLVSDVYRPLNESRFSGSATSVSEVLPHLSDDGFCFTVGRSGIEGFITPSDLDRHAARSHFYILVSGIEMGVADVLRSVLVDIDESEFIDSISRQASAPGQPALHQRFLEARAAKRDTHPVEYLYLADMIDILAASGITRPNSRLIRDLREVQGIRNKVMHSTHSLAKLGPAKLYAASLAAERAHAVMEQLRTSSHGKPV